MATLGLPGLHSVWNSAVITLGVEVMTCSRLLDIAVAIFLVAVPLTGCAGQQPRDEDPQSFGSIDEAYAAVDDVLGCDSKPGGDPVGPTGDGVRLTSAQKLCSENVQIDLYSNQDALEKNYQIWADSSQGKIPLVRGNNWIVVDLSQIAGGQVSTFSLERLAEKLNGEYAVAGT
jgi:hypothetical protein